MVSTGTKASPEGTNYGKLYTRRDRPCCCCKNWCPECGVPKCRPPQEPEWAPGTLNTEYLDRYPEKMPLKSHPAARQPYVPSLAKFDDRTTNKTDFTPKSGKLTRPKNMSRSMPSRVFDGRTTYNTAHDGKQGLPRDPRKGGAAPYQVPFDGTSTNHADYRDWGVRPQPGFKPDNKIHTAPFDGISSYQADYENKGPVPKDERKKAPLLQSSTRQEGTTYGADFVPKPFGVKPLYPCCDERTHPGYNVRGECCERPGTSCSSCVGH